jgi:hypothetical protein
VQMRAPVISFVFIERGAGTTFRRQQSGAIPRTVLS